ncbi:MAG: histidine kinase [Bacteroidetes bacterium]|jgi:DNA-binding NarL/FixJ family response regulator|nr:histidine kinase [Bacteroidota bacterium]
MSKTITIFFADDNALYLKNLELTFSSKDYYNIKTFATAELCIEALHLKPDLIILDYYLNSVEKEAMDGLQALKKIREIDSTIPVVMLSTEESGQIAENCIQHNATEFIIKGDISFARLREIITMVFLDKQIEGDLITSVHKAIRKETGRA